LLYCVDGTLVPETTRSRVEVRLFLERTCPQLTLSFDDRDGFRGAAHRHDHDLQLSLGRVANPGFTAMALTDHNTTWGRHATVPRREAGGWYPSPGWS